MHNIRLISNTFYFLNIIYTFFYQLRIIYIIFLQTVINIQNNCIGKLYNDVINYILSLPS